MHHPCTTGTRSKALSSYPSRTEILSFQIRLSVLRLSNTLQPHNTLYHTLYYSLAVFSVSLSFSWITIFPIPLNFRHTIQPHPYSNPPSYIRTLPYSHGRPFIRPFTHSRITRVFKKLKLTIDEIFAAMQEDILSIVLMRSTFFPVLCYDMLQ